MSDGKNSKGDGDRLLVLLVLWKEPARSPQTDRRTFGFHLR